MEFFLIVVLVIAVFAIWRSSQNAIERLRQDLGDLQLDMGFLRDQLAALLKAQTASPAQPKPAPVIQPEPVQRQVPPVTPPEPASAAHAVTPAIAAFTPAAAHTPGRAPEPIPAPHPPVPVPLPASVPKPWFDAIAAQKPPTPSPAAPVAQQPKAAQSASAQASEPVSVGRGISSLEQTLGANWLNKIGISCLAIGLGYYLATKFQTWGPGGKVLCGYAVSLALLAVGVWLERKPAYRIFARGGIGGGWAMAFFTTFAMYHLPAARVLDSLATDLVLMLLVAAGMVAHSLLYRSQTVTGLAFMLGFGTLITSHLEAANETLVFSLTASAVLALALVVVTTIRHWAWLELAGLIAVYISHFVWLTGVLPQDHAAFAQFWPSTALILLYWLIFRLAYVFRTPLDRKEENISSLSAVFNSIGVLGLLKYQSAHPEWAFWALLALGAIEMALAFQARSRRRQAFVVLSTIATVLLVSAVPFRFHGVTWPVLWLVQAHVLAICGLRLGEPVFRRLGLLAGLVTGGVLAFHDVVPLLFFRLEYADFDRHASVIVALALAAALYWIHAEVYPRRWPQIAEDGREAFALGITSWLGAAAAATALWVALPDLWVPVGWLALFLVLAFAAQRLAAASLVLEADALAIGSACWLAFHSIWPLALFRTDNPDPTPHPIQTAVLALAALAYWARSEIVPRLLQPTQLKDEADSSSNFDLKAWQSVALPVTSWLGAAAAAAALWVVLPAPWVGVGWLALVVALGLAADWVKAQSLAIQADLLTITALLGLFAWDLWADDWNHKAPLIVFVVLLYAGMRRKTVLVGSRNYVAPAYSWAASLVIVIPVFEVFSNPWIAPVLATLSLALFEIGRFSRRGFLRWQGFFLMALAFPVFLADDLPSTNAGASEAVLSASGKTAFSPINSLLLEVLILAAAGYWLLERTRNRQRCARAEYIVGLTADALGTLSIALWFAYRFPSYWVPLPGAEVWVTSIWAAMAAVLLALAWLMRRRAFLAQAIALVVAVVARALFVDLIADSPAGFWRGTLFHIGVTVLILLAALPFAFLLRSRDRFDAPTVTLPPDLALLLRHPEQWFFFAAFGLEVVTLAAKLSSGQITIAWSLLGLGVFLFALALGERSYRLAGLSLLLVCVGKILFMDIWRLPLSDRWITFVVLGSALFSISFLYARFGAVMRKFL